MLVFDPQDPDAVLGGLVATPGMTDANFYFMVGIALKITENYALQLFSGEFIEREEKPLQPGSYFVITSGTIEVNDEKFIAREKGNPPGPARDSNFRSAVRTRDKCCVLSGEFADDMDLARGYWGAFDVAHIFPLRHEEHWTAHKFADMISILPASGNSINSIQNGVLLRTDMHRHFDNHLVSINPDVCMDTV